MSKHRIISGIKTTSEEGGYSFEEEYAEAYVTLTLYEAYKQKRTMPYSDLLSFLEKTYPDNSINQSRLQDFLENSCQFVKRFYPQDENQQSGLVLRPEYIEIAGKLEKFLGYLDDFSFASRNELKSKAINYLKENFIKTSYISALMAAIDKQDYPKRKKEFYLGSLYSYLISGRNLCYTMDEGFLELDQSNSSLPISVLFTNPIIIEFLTAQGIQELGQMYLCNSYVLADSLFMDFQQILALIEILKRNSRDFLVDCIRAQLLTLKKNEKDYLFARHAIPPYEKEMTLECLGQRDGITRERVRQIAVKAENKFLSSATILSAFNFFFIKNFFNASYASYDDVFRKLGDSAYASLLKFVCLENSKSPIAYWEEAEVFYQKGSISKEEIVREVMNVVPNYVLASDCAYFAPLKQRIVNLYYREQNGFLIKKGLSKIQMWVDVLNDNFPDGYRPYSEDDYYRLCELLKSAYGADYELPTSTAIRGVLGRDDVFCQVERGTVKARFLVAEYLPETLVTQISDYIIDHAPSVYYFSIFSTFQKQLEELNIHNRYLLKGLLDPQLDKDVFITERDYIKIKGTNQAPRELLDEFISAQEKPFSLQDFKDKFIGVMDYTLLDSLYKYPGIVFLSNKNFVLGQNCGVSDRAERIIHTEIVSSLSKSAEHVFSTSRLFGKLKLLHKDIFAEMGYIQTSFDLFSFCQWKYSNEFSFNRPFISSDKELGLNADEILYNHLEKLNRIDKPTVDGYINRMNLHTWVRFVDIIDDFSHDFTQIDRLVLIRKEQISIPDYVLNDISDSISMIIQSQTQINGETFSAYQMFPKISGYRWNQFLLAGIVQTYLYDRFRVVRTSNNSSQYNCLIQKV